ncbi:phage holin family protein [uncultured Cobetia sp.]|uniref:phage holin family protein n=1 Tax=uncultured Cobetia sp. TaxID=410706 RepID=UPI000E9A2C72|nr:phage holin family protein [Cobetia sp.]|tara:strand:- start:43 stop:351 length:309 start_codon:yes stop_codon:yes gene_type:complete
MADTGVIQSIAPVLAACSYFIAAFRLATFRRGGLRYKRHVSLLASALIGTLLCAGLEVMFFEPEVSIFQALLAALFCALTLRARGNVATLMRMTHDGTTPTR